MKFMTLLILLSISIPAFAPGFETLIAETPERINPFEKIWAAICKIESDFDPFAYNATENSCGIAQLREIRLLDYNIRTGSDHVLSDAFDANFSKSVFMFYAHLYGHHKTDQLIKSWNGSGKRADEYVKKVKHELEKI